jgi:hypothetical protein
MDEQRIREIVREEISEAKKAEAANAKDIVGVLMQRIEKHFGLELGEELAKAGKERAAEATTADDIIGPEQYRRLVFD